MSARGGNHTFGFEHLIRESEHGLPPVDLGAVESLAKPTDESRPLVLYRGPLQRHRLRVLVRALVQMGSNVDFVWLVPSVVRPEAISWLDELDGIAALRVIDARRKRLAHSLRALRRLRLGRRPVMAIVNYSAFPYSIAVSAKVSAWFVQGIPEEDEYSASSPVKKLVTELTWRLISLVRAPTVTVAVSQPMARLIDARLRRHHVTVIPNSVSDESLIPAPDDLKRTLVYMGSGARWQNLGYLAELWSEIHEIDPTFAFRVISNDDRTRLLESKLPQRKVDFRSAWQPADVASLLSGCSAGFLIRTPHIINRVSCPVKFGEYLGASVPVVATDMEWDIAETIREAGCGHLVDLSLPIRTQALRIVEWLEDPTHRAAVDSATDVGRTLSDAAISGRIAALFAGGRSAS